MALTVHLPCLGIFASVTLNKHIGSQTPKRESDRLPRSRRHTWVSCTTMSVSCS